MSFQLRLDRNGESALYQQIAVQIKDRIADGSLPAGSRLPTVRQLARDAGVTRLTVQNAYGELQSGGWIESTVGRGTFVSAGIGVSAAAATLGRDVTPDAVIDDIINLHSVTGIRSMASASPDAALFPAQEFWSALGAMQADVATIANYGSTQGDPQLRVALAEWLQDRDLRVTPDELLVVNGVSQALTLLGQALAQPGDVVAVEDPTYLGFLHTLKTQGLHIQGVPLDNEGPRLDTLEEIVTQQRPRFFYTVPSFQNPTGISMTPARRRALIELSRRHELVIIEDDIYGRLAYDGPPPPALKSLDQDGLVVHVGSVSKLFMPGLRMGYLLAPPPLRARLLSLRRSHDLCSPPLLQRALARFLNEGGMKRHVRRVLPVYRERRNAMVRALQRSMPAGVTWTEPAGGFCTWLTLPQAHAFDDLQQAAMRKGWAFAPGEAFATTPDAGTHLRLAYGNLAPDGIAAGVAVLAGLIEERIHLDMPAQYTLYDSTPLV